MKTTKFFRSMSILIVMAAMLLPGTAISQERDIYDRIREEGTKNSQVMRILHNLTDVYGPRLTGSPQMKAANEWTAAEMTRWGMENAALEPWDFGSPGWASERASGFITSPVQDSLVFEVLAWTPSTNGAVKGKAFNFILPDRPTQAELTAYFDKIRNDVRGSIVFYGNPGRVPVNINPPAKRLDGDEAKRRVNPDAPPPQFQGPQFTPPPAKEGALPFGQINSQVNQFFIDSGVLVRVNDAGREHGQIRAFSVNPRDPTKTVPTVVMRNEDFGRVVRLLRSGRAVELEFDIRNKIYPEGSTAYNTVAEIVGTDKKDEVVMLGGHLDSWHSATGATDNATGCTVMMEAARILKALGVKPRRTIRVALWSGEEQGLLGSRAYVAKHFGTAENPKPAWSKFNGYINHDTGTGRIRGLTVFGPPEAASMLRRIVGPLAFMGIEGATMTRSRNIGGTDHTSFNNAGLPGIGTSLDPIEYQTHTWHTNLDTYERIIEADVQQSAIVAAAVVYHLAMMDEMIPRFSAEQMPRLNNPNL
ncbi:MAG: M20/M25/M40 family metallo-hydrolase [Chloracidobacterium sp.]|nr:M20/M25/M40 family metallo-hydrolase [Chloracidobacterium sp.]